MVGKHKNKSEKGSILLNTMFVLLFFNISFVAILGYSQSINADFQRLIQRQQTGQTIFAFFESAPDQLPFHGTDKLKITTRPLLQSERCQKIEGYVADNVLPIVSLYYWSCYP